MIPYKKLNITYNFGMLLALAGVIICLAKLTPGGYLLSAGALIILSVRIHNRWKAVKEKERIYTIMIFSSLILCSSAVLWFLGENYWILMVFISALMDVYASFRKV
jgi:Na+/melibiose symporter-like transporter